MNFNKLEELPYELLRVIKSYIPKTSLLFVNKKYYEKYHCLIKFIIPKNNYENYIRNTVRRDNEFSFLQILNDNFKRWFKNKNYIYKNILYKNYFYFLSDYCINNNSVKCRNVLNDFLKQHGLCQNRHKKNTFIHIRWKT